MTITEAVTVLGRLGRPLTARQIRYLGLTSVGRSAGLNGGRVYESVDLALVAIYADLLARFQQLGLPAWSARAALRYREAEIRRALARRQPRYLVLDPVTGTATLSATRDTRAATIDLQDWRARVTSAVEAHRRASPKVWTGSAYVQPADLAHALHA